MGELILGELIFGGAYLRGVKNYVNLCDFAQEIIRRQTVKTFTIKEWIAIGQIFLHRFCWEIIKKKYLEEAKSISEKLAKIGFDEYLKEIEKK